MGATLPLEGLRVLDFSRLLPGPYASLVMADLGADVVKIEAPQGGDYLRFLPPLTGEVSYAFHALNSGKRSLAVDLKHPEGQAVVAALAAEADVVLESFRPGVMDRLGLGYEALRAVNPGVVFCAISGFGQDGPYRDRPGHDLNYAALAGALGLAGPADRPPALPSVQVADMGGAMWSLVGILAALNARDRTGEGAFVDVSMTDGVTGLLTMALAPLLGGGAPAPPRGTDTLTGGQPCYGVYETRDGGHFSVAPLEPKFWQAFCAAVDKPEWLDRQYGDPALEADLAALFATRDRDAWAALLEGAGACCHPVLRPQELADHPLHVARGNVIRDAAGMARVRVPIRPRAAAPPGAAPALGEHSRDILAGLGRSEAEIDALIAAGAVVDGALG